MSTTDLVRFCKRLLFNQDYFLANGFCLKQDYDFCLNHHYCLAYDFCFNHDYFPATDFWFDHYSRLSYIGWGCIDAYVQSGCYQKKKEIMKKKKTFVLLFVSWRFRVRTILLPSNVDIRFIYRMLTSLNLCLSLGFYSFIIENIHLISWLWTSCVCKRYGCQKYKTTVLTIGCDYPEYASDYGFHQYSEVLKPNPYQFGIVAAQLII